LLPAISNDKTFAMASITAFTGNVPLNYETYLGPLFFEPYAQDLAERLPDNKCGKILELACGTGRVTKYLIRKLREDGRLFATDLNEAMLSIGREKVNDPRVQWSAIDAHELPYEKESIDLIVCQFGVMFFQDRPKAFREAFRVLRSGETFLFNTWDHIQHNTLTEVTRKVMDQMFPDDPAPFLTKGPFSFFDKEHIHQLLADTGFKDITIDTVRITSTASSVQDCLNGIVDGTPISAYLQERNTPAYEVKGKVAEALEEYRENDILKLPMQAHVCYGRKP